MNKKICYCFGYTVSDIEADVIANNGESTITMRIKAEKLKGACRCHETNPSGKWCLADVHRVVDKARKNIGPTL